MKLKLLFIASGLALSFLFISSWFTTNTAYAQRGCCSYHGGVAYCDSSVGRYVCNDGTYSPSCGCYFQAPQPTPFVLSNVKASVEPIFVTDSYNVYFDWDDVSNSSGYSVSISKYAGADPGPNYDTHDSRWTFHEVTPGKWYVNLKAAVNNNWSNVSYWTIDVPPYPTPTLTPTPTQVPTITEVQKQIDSGKHNADLTKQNHSKSFFQSLLNFFGNIFLIH